MKLEKFEQSGFILQTDGGFRLAFDIGNKTPVEKLSGITVDAMLVSHIHGDHFSLDQIKALAPNTVYLNAQCISEIGEESVSFEIVKVASGENITVGGVEVEYFPVDHGPNATQPLENLGFILHVDGQTIYFAGDMYYPPDMDVKNLEVDVALIPVGGWYTFGPQEAFDFAKTFKRIGKIISMHYERNNHIDPVRHDEFVQLAQGTFTVE